MRLLKVVVSYPKTLDTHTYTFGTADSGNGVLVGKTKRLGKHLSYCFGADNSGTTDVAVEMEVNGSVFILQRHHIEGGHSVLLQSVSNDVVTDIASGSEAYTQLEQLTRCTMPEMLSAYYVSNKQFEAFDGVLTNVATIRAYDDISHDIDRSTASIESRRADIRAKAVSAVNDVAPTTTKKQIEQLSTRLAKVSSAVANTNQQLSQLKAEQASSTMAGEIVAELAKAQVQYDALAQQKSYIESQREILSQHDKIASLLPKINRISEVGKQSQALIVERAQLTKELEWQENELSSATMQLEEKQRLATEALDKRSKIEVINQELTHIASLYEDNKLHNEKLIKLTEQEQRLCAERVMIHNKLAALEGKSEDIKQDISALSIPEQSIGELIESARIDVKVDEVKAQIDKLTAELAVKESRIAEKESNLVMQVKKFRSVAELDVAVAPLKAKDTILQVLDSKCGKLETINDSLLQKQRNLQRALEDYRYRILELEHSRAVLDNNLAKMIEGKQEEFKREVYLNSQKVYSDDASAVFAVVSNLEDQEVTTLRQDITKRTLDRDVLLERASELDGRLAEIARQMDINSAEMATLRGEKANINTRYNEIIASNRSESVFNYLKALESNNGTKYLLDVQNDAVRNEAELAEYKRNADAIRTKLSGLQSRHRYLVDTQAQLGTDVSLDLLVAGNDKMRDQLQDIGDRLTITYQQQRSLSASLESCDNKLAVVRAEIVELSKTVKVNQKQIAASNDKARAYAGGDDIEQAISAFRYEISDVESERQMLVDSKRQLEADVFRNRLQGEKLQYNIDSAQSEIASLRDDINLELGLLGMSLESVLSANIVSDMSSTRQLIAEYDTTRSSIAQRIDNYYTLLADHPQDADGNQLLASIVQLQTELDALTAEQTELEAQRATMLEEYSIANNSKLRQTVAATRAATLGDMAEALAHNNIIKLLISDKIDSIVRQAEVVLATIIDKRYNLSVLDGNMLIFSDNAPIFYIDMPVAHQFALYLALILACPDVDASQGRWIVLDDKLPLEGTEIASLVARIEGMSYHTDYSIVKGAK